MDIQELKKMLKNSATILILDDGEPSFVVVNYESYKKLAMNDAGSNQTPKESEPPLADQTGNGVSEIDLLERINKDILALKAEIENEEKGLGIDGK